jgi:hypothetical protein
MFAQMACPPPRWKFANFTKFTVIPEKPATRAAPSAEGADARKGGGEADESVIPILSPIVGVLEKCFLFVPSASDQSSLDHSRGVAEPVSSLSVESRVRLGRKPGSGAKGRRTVETIDMGLPLPAATTDFGAIAEAGLEAGSTLQAALQAQGRNTASG